MSDLTHINPADIKSSLFRNGVWNQNSFTHIATAMFYYRPSRCLYISIADADDTMRVYSELIDIACEYADALGYPWMNTKLKDIVWVDFKGFYDTLAHIVRDNIKEMPLSAHDKELMSMLAAIWVKVGTFSDEHDITPLVANENKMQMPKQPFGIPPAVTIPK